MIEEILGLSSDPLRSKTGKEDMKKWHKSLQEKTLMSPITYPSQEAKKRAIDEATNYTIILTCL